MKKWFLTAGFVVLVVATVIFLISREATTPNNTTTLNGNLSGRDLTEVPKRVTPPPMTIKEDKQYTAILHTDKGDLTLELNSAVTPATVNNFVYLAQQHFYDNTIFHRVINGFMIQGGDPLGTGAGGPGYTFNDEPILGEYVRGVVAMANAGPNTNGSQFFIMHADYPLPKNYVIFGVLTDGFETLDTIAEAPVESNPFGEPSKPVAPVKVTSVEITIK